jgi:hypothetical protein
MKRREEKHKRNRRRKFKKILDALCEEYEPEHPSDNERNEHFILGLKGFDRACQKSHHRLINSEGNAKNTSAYSRKNRADADYRALYRIHYIF